MDVRIVPYRDAYGPDFTALNLEWLEAFGVEPEDRRYLDDPRGSIVDPGGEIFFVLEDDSVAGTVAMIDRGGQAYELSKMAVRPSSRGRGHGDRLMEAAIGWARERGARRIFLESNTVLEPAIRLYAKHGFRTTREGAGDRYARSNIEMDLDLDAPA